MEKLKMNTVHEAYICFLTKGITPLWPNDVFARYVTSPKKMWIVEGVHPERARRLRELGKRWPIFSGP